MGLKPRPSPLVRDGLRGSLSLRHPRSSWTSAKRRRAEEEVEAPSARLLRATFDLGGSGHGDQRDRSRRQRWLRVNQKLCDILGRTREELLGDVAARAGAPGERRHAADFNEKLLRDEVATYAGRSSTCARTAGESGRASLLPPCAARRKASASYSGRAGFTEADALAARP
jgi:PAS domain-containing protein